MATISSLLADHVTLQVRSVDRLFLQGYVPNLMCEGQVIRFLLDRGFPIPSPAVLGKIGRDYVNQINQFIVDHGIPTVKFVKGDVKEEIARKHFQQAERDGRYGVVMVGATLLERVVLPSTTPDGLPAPGLRFGEPRTMALLACLCSYQHLFIGLTNRSLRALIAGLIPGYGARQMTYDLRRLRRKGFIQRIPRTQRYQLTDEGYRLAVFFTKTYTRIVNPTLAELDPALPTEIANRSTIARTWRAYEHELNARIAAATITS